LEDADDERGEEESDTDSDWHLDEERDDEIDSEEDRGGLKNVEDTEADDEGPRAGRSLSVTEDLIRERV
jgi:hypothetical protein